MNLELVTEGLQFPEGPIAMSDGSVIVVEIKRQTLTRVNPDGTQDIIAHLGGGPNGAAIGPDGAVYICNNGGFDWRETDGLTVPHGMAADYKTGSIQRVDLATGSFDTLYAACDGRALRGPNDIVFDQDGGFWITDHGKTNGDWTHVGHLLYARPDGSFISRVREGMNAPNGIGLSPDQKTLHVAETPTSRLWNLEIEAPGKLAKTTAGWVTPKQVYGPLPGYQLLDSLAVEADGKVCVATLINGGITVFDSEGDFSHHAVPDPVVTNICFGGEDMCDAWITASGTGKLYKCRWPRPGLQLNYNA